MDVKKALNFLEAQTEIPDRVVQGQLLGAVIGTCNLQKKDGSAQKLHMLTQRFL